MYEEYYLRCKLLFFFHIFFGYGTLVRIGDKSTGGRELNWNNRMVKEKGYEIATGTGRSKEMR